MLNSDSMHITNDLLLAIAELEAFRGAWRAASPLAPDRLAALARQALVENVGASLRIEGRVISDQTVESLLNTGSVNDPADATQQIVLGYAQAMDAILAGWQDVTLSEDAIRQLHLDMLRHSDQDQPHRGSYKRTANPIAAYDADGVQTGIFFATAQPFDTPRLMSELVAWLIEARAVGRLHPLLMIGVFIAVFLEIHPFQDGNGRLSRLLTTLLLLQAGYLYLPFCALDRIIEQSKPGYYLALRHTQTTIRNASPNWQAWLEFFLGALQLQKRQLVAQVEWEQEQIGQIREFGQAQRANGGRPQA